MDLLNFKIGYWIKKYPWVDRPEIESACLMGITKAADNFNEDRGVLFSTFANKVIDNEVLMVLRTIRKNKEIPISDLIATKRDDEQVDPWEWMHNFIDLPDQMQQLENSIIIEKALERLTEQERAALVLFYVHNFKHKEISDLLHIKKYKSAQLKKQAIDKLRIYFKEKGIARRRQGGNI